jgi:hypothetical protein
MHWSFPLDIPRYNSTTNEFDTITFDSKEGFLTYLQSRIKIPGEYNLKNTKSWKHSGNEYTRTVTRPNFEGGRYCPYAKGTYQYKKFWEFEKQKVKNGIIIDDQFLPPFYFFYLNYCPIYNDVRKKKELPDVWDSDLYFFQNLMLAMLLGMHMCVVKARQRGYSFKIMSVLYWSYCWFEGSVNTIGASKDEYTLKSWRFLEFYRKHINTTTAWKRGPVTPKSQEWYERTQLKSGEYVGLDSKLSATTFKISPENGVGGSQSIFFYEEAGIAPTLLKTLGFVRPALEKGNVTTGTIIVSGSVGELEDCKDLKEIFYSPEDHNFLSVNNVWDKDTNNKKCGIFISEAYNLAGFIDSEGNSLVKEATEFVISNNQKVKNTKRKDLAQLDISQKPLSPKEAFAQRNISEFPIEQMQRQQERIKLKDKENRWAFKPIKCLLYEDNNGKVCFDTKNLPEEHEYPIDPKWEDKRGVVTIYQLPEENPKWLTYFAGVDTVEVDETTTSDSVQSVDIYMRARKVKYTDEKGKVKTRYEGGKIVATYRGRFNPIEKHNEQTWLLIKLYNAFSYVERSKPNFINYMKRNGRAERYLAKESDVPINKDLNIDTYGSASSYGFIISNNNQMMKILKNSVKEFFATEFDRLEKSDGELIKIYNGVDRTDDYWLLEEYIQYTDKQGNYDRIISHSAAITIGKIYENELGIPTIDETKKKVEEEQVIIPRRPISMLGGYVSPNRGIQKKISLL